MNHPQQPYLPGVAAPSQGPIQPAAPQQAVQAVPQQPPQQPLPPQQPVAYPQPGQQQPPPPPAHAAAYAAANNVMAGYLQAPKQTAISRQKIDDGEYVVSITSVEFKASQQTAGQYFLLLSYSPISGSVPGCIGQEYGHPVKWEKPWQVQELCEVYKSLVGEQQAAQLAVNPPEPASLAQTCAQLFQQYLGQGPLYTTLTAQRSRKQVSEKGYEEAYPNHVWGFFSREQPVPQQQVAQQPVPQQPPQPGALPPPQQAPPAPGMPVQTMPAQPQQPTAPQHPSQPDMNAFNTPQQ